VSGLLQVFSGILHPGFDLFGRAFVLKVVVASDAAFRHPPLRVLRSILMLCPWCSLLAPLVDHLQLPFSLGRARSRVLQDM
jgi:hypothetical protein